KTQAQLDLDAVNAAKAAIENGMYRIAQATANTDATVKAWLVNTLGVLFGQSSGIQFRAASVTDAVVTMKALTPATAGTAAIPTGTNGSFRFTVTLTQGAAGLETAEVSGVIIAMPYAAMPVKNIEIVQLGETTVRLLNTGNIATGALTLTLTGSQANVFTLATLAPGSLTVGGEADIVFTTRSGLASGTYTAVLTATADGLTPVTAEITYTVAPTATEEVASTALRAYAADGGLTISGLIPGESLTLYNMQGQLVYKGKATANEQRISLHGHGVYIVVNGNRTVKAAY
ncbi:MAG: T9SS type A sorting domain-containing protein, partial [Tannerella sp.]|nr:T9SS type A sorting domain-containing protein [Tannerella sp.]